MHPGGPRAEMLAELMPQGRSVAIAGSPEDHHHLAVAPWWPHGAGPTAVVGGKLNALGSTQKPAGAS
jgi:hypothetical protein